MAVKRIQRIDDRGDEQQSVLSSLYHTNVVIAFRDRRPFKYHALELCAASLDQLFLADKDPKKYRGPMPPYDMIVLLQLATGLHYIHSNDLVHGDIRPENVLISTGTAGSRQRVLMKWADFALCRSDDENSKWKRSNWVAPEMIQQFDEDSNRHPAGKKPTSAAATFESDVFRIHPFGPHWEIRSNLVRNKQINFTSKLNISS